MNKKKFLFYHFTCSVIVGVVIAVIVFGVWYPSPFAAAIGVPSIFSILLLVDLVIGPLLTSIVYKEAKASLKFDLSVIIFIQIAALLYGMFTIAQGRPVWIVFNIDRFDVVQSYQLSADYRAKAKDEFNSSNWFGPKWVAAAKSTDETVNSDLLFESLSGGADLPHRPDLYVPYEQELKSVQKKAIPIGELKKFNNLATVSKALTSYPDVDAYLPLVSTKQSMVVLIQRDTAKIKGVVELKPW